MSKTRVLILTHKLGHNYGGMLQAYALQEILRRSGVEAITTDFHENSSIIFKAKWYLKYFVRRALHFIFPSIRDLPPNAENYINQPTQEFINSHIEVVDSRKIDLGNISQQYSALVVGSDQVWRSSYVPVEKYLFDFAENQEITRISYAASFGRDDLTEYSPELLKRSAQLAKRFDAISVREDSGVSLVEKHWGMKAECHVDPTMLLEKEDYISLIKEDELNTSPATGNLFVYVLDRDGEKGPIIDKSKMILRLKDFEIMPATTQYRDELLANPQKFQLRPVTQWIKSFIEAEFVITDSFHGTAFSIIFNKPFLAIGNKERGLARFTSLLKKFNLENRLVYRASDVKEELLRQKIDWKQVELIKRKERKRSYYFLDEYLQLRNTINK